MAIAHFIRNFDDLDFTVNTGASEVQLNNANPALGESPTLLYFDYGENINIEGLCLTLPYQFGQGVLYTDERPRIGLYWYDTAAHSGPVTEFGVNGYIYPFEVNTLIPLDIFVNQPGAATTKWGIYLHTCNLSINMFNTPAALNTQVLEVVFYLKIRHTLPMIT